MNQVVLIGRLTRDPEVRYTSESQMAVARFTIAINRMRGRDGSDKGADFIPIVVFGRQAETCEKYLSKGRMVAVNGRIQTGSYQNKEGNTVYTTDVVANNVEFLSSGDRQSRPEGGESRYQQRPQQQSSYDDRESGIPEGFQSITDDDIPF